MSRLRINELPFEADARQLFARIAHLPWAQLLDSCQTDHPRSRYDILVADPVLRFVTQHGRTNVHDRTDQLVESSTESFGLIKQYLNQFPSSDCDLPFCGGIIGYFAYDLSGQANDNRPALQELPDMACGLYEWALITDHLQRRTQFVSINPALTPDQVMSALPAQPTNNPFTVQALQSDTGFEQYQVAFDRIQHYLREGDCYQVNYARCFRAQFSGDPWQVYCQLREQNPVPFAAYLNFPFARVISCSPERFIKVSGDQVETCPIKGTRRRSRHTAEDQRLARELATSTKDRAENLMIVDLLRNDLGKTCIPGSIKVPDLFAIEGFPTVFHMVSTITGTLQVNNTMVDVLQESFPGGSITGAPKKRAMEIIEELETYRRQLYCGAIGYLSLNGHMDTNIAIRTLVADDNQLVFWAGGGIVADSDVRQEFDETNDKAEAFLRLLNPNT